MLSKTYADHPRYNATADPAKKAGPFPEGRAGRTGLHFDAVDGALYRADIRAFVEAQQRWGAAVCQSRLGP